MYLGDQCIADLLIAAGKELRQTRAGYAGSIRKLACADPEMLYILSKTRGNALFHFTQFLDKRDFPPILEVIFLFANVTIKLQPHKFSIKKFKFNIANISYSKPTYNYNLQICKFKVIV